MANQPLDEERPWEMDSKEPFKPHPGLSDEINNNIAQSEIDGGADLRKLGPVKTLHVQTQNTHYEIQHVQAVAHGDAEYLIRGSARFCPNWTRAAIHGSTWGGSMLKVKYIGIGMHMEFWIAGHGTIITSRVEKVWET